MFCKNCGNTMPEGATFCAACGTPVPAEAPAATAPTAAGKISSNNLVKLIAIVAAAVLLIVAFASILGGGSPKSIAKKYVQAQLDGDMKKMYSMMAGKMQKCFEEEIMDDYDDELFEMMEEACDDEDIDVKIKNYNQFYKAAKKLNKAQMNEEYGKGYKVKIRIREVEDLRNSEIDDIQDYLDSDTYEDYIDSSKIKKGKKVTVAVNIEGKESDDADDIEVYIVKYKGKWKVVDASFAYMF